jgi:hypothetical protein
MSTCEIITPVMVSYYSSLDTIYLINGFTVFPKSVCYTDADDIAYELSLGNDEDEEGEEEETDEEEEETGAGGAVEKEKA